MFALTTLLIVTINLLHGQSITRQTNVGLVHPWKVIDNGGGKSTADEFTLQTSIGHSAVQAMSLSKVFVNVVCFTMLEKQL